MAPVLLLPPSDVGGGDPVVDCAGAVPVVDVVDLDDVDDDDLVVVAEVLAVQGASSMVMMARSV